MTATTAPSTSAATSRSAMTPSGTAPTSIEPNSSRMGVRLWRASLFDGGRMAERHHAEAVFRDRPGRQLELFDQRLEQRRQVPAKLQLQDHPLVQHGNTTLTVEVRL